MEEQDPERSSGQSPDKVHLEQQDSTASYEPELPLPMPLWQRIVLGYWPKQPPVESPVLENNETFSGLSADGNNDFKQDVILRVEFISDAEYRVRSINTSEVHCRVF